MTHTTTDKPKQKNKPKRPSPLTDPLLDIYDLIGTKIVGGRDGVKIAIADGWLPEPIRWPNGRMFWRKSVIEQVVANIESNGAGNE